MKKFIVHPEFWELFPQGEIEILLVSGIDNHFKEEKVPYFSELLKNSAKEAKQFLGEEVFSENLVIQEWREALSKFKTKKGARSSIEALLKRVQQGRKFTPILPLVDIYNSISLRYGVPCGGEDIEKIVGNMTLGKAKGGEAFFPLGADKDAPALPEEIIYADDEGAICRCLNWREAQRTMLTENTQQAILLIEAVNVEQTERARMAISELKNRMDHYFDVNSTIFHLTKNNPEVVIEEKE